MATPDPEIPDEILETYETSETPETPETQNCPVCLEPIEIMNSTTTPCGHSYHFTCFMRAFENSYECSVCRSDVFPERTNEENRASSEDVMELTLEDLGEDAVNEIRSQIREQLQIHLNPNGNTGDMAQIRRRRTEFELFKSCEDGDLNAVTEAIHRNTQMKFAEDDELNTLLHSSILSENENMVRYLINELSLPVNVHNIYRLFPIHFSVLSKSNRLTRLLLNCGAFVDPQDSTGRTPLIIACQKNESEICSTLIDNNASVRAFDANGDTALHFASRVRGISCLRAILSNERADPNSQNFFGDTPLHSACLSGSTSSVNYLLNKGADTTIQNKAGHKPIDCVPRDNSRLRNIIREHSME